MRRSVLLAAALLAAMPAGAQTNRAGRVTAPLGAPSTASLLKDLRITLPGEESPLSPTQTTARVFIPPELLISNTDDTASMPAPIPLLRESYSPEVNLHMVSALRLMSSNQVYLASRELWQASRLAPGLPEPAAGLALGYLLAEDNERAGNLLEKLVALHPANDDYRFNLASARYGQKRHAEAVELLKGLVHSEKYPVRVFYNLGINLQAMGRVPEAVAALRQAHAILPRNPAPLLAIARLHARRGEEAPMLAVLREAMPLLPAEQRRSELAEPVFAPFHGRPEFQGLLDGEPAP